MKKLLLSLIILACVGFALSTYAFLHNRGFASGAICTINATINCDIVNKGPYAYFWGIPVAFLGMIGYLFMLIGSILKYRSMSDRTLTLFLLALAYMSFGFSLYLTSIEATILFAWCLICIASQLITFTFAILATILAHKENHFNLFRRFFNLIRRFVAIR